MASLIFITRWPVALVDLVRLLVVLSSTWTAGVSGLVARASCAGTWG
jgi:hypothetical protein